MSIKKNNNAVVFSINISKEKRVVKKPVCEAELIEDFGFKDDAHSGPGIRQVSLLAKESIEKQLACPKIKKKGISLSPGDFAENITTSGIDLSELNIGDTLKVGNHIILEISKIGKECHQFCEIYKKLGDCIMPKEGIFAKVIKGGMIKVDDEILKQL